jgi:hypothetical protein
VQQNITVIKQYFKVATFLYFHAAGNIFISTIGRIPGTLMLSFQGAQVYQGQYGSFFTLLAVSMAIALPCYLFRKQILATLGQYNEKAIM